MHPERCEMKIKINKGCRIAQSINHRIAILRESAELHIIARMRVRRWQSNLLSSAGFFLPIQKDTMLKMKFLLPLLILLSAIVWWLVPHYSDEDKGYYIAVFCTLTKDGRDNSPNAMQQIIEGSNSDYALQKIRFKSDLAEHLQKVWRNLTPAQQQQAHQTALQCRQIMSTVMLPGKPVE